MKTSAAVLRAFSSDKPYATSRPLTVEQLELDEPAHSEVLVRNHERRRVPFRSLDAGRHPCSSRCRLVLGHEAARRRRKVGPGVTRVAPGDHVVFNLRADVRSLSRMHERRPGLCEPGTSANAKGTLLRNARRFHAGDEAYSHHLA